MAFQDNIRPDAPSTMRPAPLDRSGGRSGLKTDPPPKGAGARSVPPGQRGQSVFPKVAAQDGTGVEGKLVRRPERTASVQAYLPETAKGMGVLLKHFFKNTKEMVLGQRNDPILESLDDGITTVSYPEQKRPYPLRNRGIHRLTVREDGSPRCVACLCCSTACPAQCIYIEPAEYPEDDPRRGYERYPATFAIDELRCIFCGFCVEACPCDAIRMDTGMHAVPYDSRDQFLYGKDMLLSFKGRDGERTTANPRVEPPDPEWPGLTRHRHHA